LKAEYFHVADSDV